MLFSRYEIDFIPQLFRNECQHFGLESIEFPLVDELQEDISTYEDMWRLYEEFNGDLETMSKEDWISFRFVYFLMIVVKKIFAGFYLYGITNYLLI